MTLDEHCNRLGRLMGNLQSLEFSLRAFLQSLPSARQIGMPHGTDFYSFPVGYELPENEITSYDTLAALISRFNAEMAKRGEPALDMTIVDVRDALAHGRVSASAPDGTLRLIKFSRPDKRHRVRVVFNEEMTKAWFRDQIGRVHKAILAVHKLIPE